MVCSRQIFHDRLFSLEIPEPWTLGISTCTWTKLFPTISVLVGLHFWEPNETHFPIKLKFIYFRHFSLRRYFWRFRSFIFNFWVLRRVLLVCHKSKWRDYLFLFFMGEQENILIGQKYFWTYENVFLSPSKNKKK